MKKTFVLLVAMFLAFSLVACGGNGSQSSAPAAPKAPAASSGGGASSSGSSSASTKAPLVMYWIGKVPGGGYWSGVEAGLRAAAEEFNIDMKMFGVDRETDVEKQINLLADAIAAKPAAILMAPVDSFALEKPVAEAYQAGIPIILVDTKVASGDQYTAAILTNNFEAGRTCASLMARFMKEDGIKEGLIGLYYASAGSQTVIDRHDGFVDYWNKEANLPGIKLLLDDIKYSDGDSTKAISNTLDMMTRYGKDLVGLFGGTGDSVQGANAAAEAGNKDVIIVGMDFNVDSCNRLKEGWIRGSCAQQTYRMGYEGTKMALDAMAGKTWTGDNKLVDSGLLAITKENVDSDEVKLILELINR